MGLFFGHYLWAFIFSTLYSNNFHFSLITGRGGGLQNGRRGAHEVLPLRKGGGGETVFGILKGGHNKFWVVFMR